MILGPAQVDSAARAIRDRWPGRPRAGIILGSGLGELAGDFEVETRIDYASIPHLPPATAPGHRGQWICGALAGVPIVAMAGRFHAYEGYSAGQIAFPVRVMQALGIELLVLSNACGGLNPEFSAGDVMVVDDQINLTFANPLVGPHDLNPGLGYPDMSRPFDPRLVDRALAVARKQGFVARRGVYVGVTGPNYETRAEYRFLRAIGGDAVGMSTVHEVIVAVQCGLAVLALAVVTNVCSSDRLRPTTAGHVISVAESAAPKVRAILSGILAADASPPRG